jgi:hypothetical protein
MPSESKICGTAFVQPERAGMDGDRLEVFTRQNGGKRLIG